MTAPTFMRHDPRLVARVESWPRKTHEWTAYQHRATERPAGYVVRRSYPRADGSWAERRCEWWVTADGRLMLSGRYADCVPKFIHDELCRRHQAGELTPPPRMETPQ